MATKQKVVFFILLSLGLIITLVVYFFLQKHDNNKVESAYLEKKHILIEQLKSKNMRLEDIHILMVAYKMEQELAIYVKNKQEKKYQFLISYPICSKSGALGPKRMAGDRQIPEGFYYIDRFNPKSSYYLSLGISYPNESDKRKSKAKDLGGDIFIHGECVSIGCLAMTNDKIKAIYLYALTAKENGQKKIPVYIFPYKMTNTPNLPPEYDVNSSFWENLGTGYQVFQQNLEELTVSVDSVGNYVFGTNP